MARGGARPGAGRKRGSATKKTREIADKVAENGVTPLEFMLKVMNSENESPAARFEAAKAAAPYIHPKLSSIEAMVDHEGEIDHTITAVEFLVVDPATGPGR